MATVLPIHAGARPWRPDPRRVVQENLKRVREGLKGVMEIPWDIVSRPAPPKAKAKEEVVFAK